MSVRKLTERRLRSIYKYRKAHPDKVAICNKTYQMKHHGRILEKRKEAYRKKKAEQQATTEFFRLVRLTYI